jgi:hypothetical protein
MTRINSEWHSSHPMPRNARLEQRVEWHLAHARACACRPIPKTVLAELKARRIPASSAPGGARGGTGRTSGASRRPRTRT